MLNFNETLTALVSCVKDDRTSTRFRYITAAVERSGGIENATIV